MPNIFARLLSSTVLLLIAGCGSQSAPEKNEATAKPPASAAIDPQLISLESKPLHKFNEKEIDVYLKHLHATEPDLRRRMTTLARKNLEQPYELYLLGEAPFETTDPQPVYCLDRSDCVVFAEHTLAMALSDSWPQFMSMLQRIRYKDGAIGVVTRNHYTEADWNKNNAWLAREITEEIGDDAVKPFTQKVDRAKFFRDRYKLENTNIAVQTINENYIPYDRIDSVKAQLRDGDIVNFVNGVGDGLWVGHVGLVAHGEDGAVHLIHSAKPAVREETIESYIARQNEGRAEKEAANKSTFRGFKFLRLAEDPWANLRALDGADAPRVSVPEGSKLTFEQYLASFGG